MKNNKHKIIELFIYVLIVIVGLILLILGKSKEPDPPPQTTPTAQVSIQSAERGIYDAALLDRQG